MRRPSSAQSLLAALAALVMLWLTSTYVSLHRTTASLIARLESTGTAGRNPDAVRDVARETDRLRAGLKAARVLLAEELDRRWLADLSPAARDEALTLGESKLEAARDLALEALRDRPGSWQGLMMLGGARYLLASRRGTPGRWTDRASWERPLLAAIDRAPFQPEPKRLLAAAYLSEWSIASPNEREEALEVIRNAFRDLDTLDLLLPIWLRLASSFEQALSIVPADPRAWRQLDHYYRTREDWQRLAVILERLDRTLPEYFRDRVDSARRMIGGGESGSGRQELLAAVREIPRRREYAGLFAEAIDLLPAGPVSSRQGTLLREWIDWAAEGCVIAECALPDSVLQRLTGLARGQTPSQQALDAVLAGDLATGARIEEQSLTLVTRDWIPYLLLKARRLSERGETEQAVRVLQRVPTRTEYDLIAQHLRQALTGQLASEAVLDSDWLGSRGSYRREFLDTRGIERLLVRFDAIGAGGCTLEVRVNQALEGLYAIEPGSTLELEIAPRSDFVLVELVHEAGEPFRPSNSI